MARSLGPAEYGPFALVSTLTMMATVIADWGLLLVGARAVARRPEEERRILRACLSLRLLLGVAALILLIGLAFAGSSDPESTVAAAVAGLSFLPGAWLAVGHIVAQVELRMERVAIPLVLGSLASMAWLLGVLALDGGIVALAASFVAASVVSAVAVVLMTDGRVPLMPRRDPELWRAAAARVDAGRAQPDLRDGLLLHRRAAAGAALDHRPARPLRRGLPLRPARRR